MVVSMKGVRGKLKAGHAAHGRSEGNRMPPAPLSPKTRDWALPGFWAHWHLSLTLG
ncbi:hypothetical protein [Candidatus Methylacidithermus pantelleriae]|uniref:Uncharacterized protein n=1 Tax=Candidatus Methylacidithermus pantelleriae TaxID=2744239 RepID=A0A8J2BUR6_9BACT|nr:hypothetical protein [Candidatus Methylacidithermus pantelleriae]CAF0700608.1 hypothetical protein MPNT_390003 [Candidatus Methylacidithermus pantelleriae]